MEYIELIKFDLKPVLVDLESTHARIGPGFSVICVNFCESCRFGELGEREKRESTRIDRARQAWPGTSIGWLGIDTCANRSRFFYYCWGFSRCFCSILRFKATRSNGSKKVISGIDRARWTLSGTSVTIAGIGCRTNRTRKYSNRAQRYPTLLYVHCTFSKYYRLFAVVFFVLKKWESVVSKIEFADEIWKVIVPIMMTRSNDPHFFFLCCSILRLSFSLFLSPI